MARYILTKEIRSETKIGFANLYVFDFFFLIIYGILVYMLGILVTPDLKVAYYIFSAVMAILLTMPSMVNKKRRNYQSLIIFMKKESGLYRPVKNISMDRKKEE